MQAYQGAVSGRPSALGPAEGWLRRGRGATGESRTDARIAHTEPTPVAPQPSSFLPGIYTSAATFSSLCVRGCASVRLCVHLACMCAACVSTKARCYFHQLTG